MWFNSQFPADLVAFTGELLNGQLHFLCCEEKQDKRKWKFTFWVLWTLQFISTNAIFEHKTSHQTTRISPLPPTFSRKSLYQNQIDYIPLIKSMNSKIFDSRSFNSNIARPNYKPVTAKIQIKWTYMKNTAGTKSFKLSNLQDKQIT